MRQDSNLGPSAYQADALPTELRTQLELFDIIRNPFTFPPKQKHFLLVFCVYEKRCARCFVPPILFRSRAHMWLSNDTGLRYPASEYRLETSTIFSPALSLRKGGNRHDTPFGNIDSISDMFHEQVPLPVPCSVSPRIAARHGLYHHPFFKPRSLHRMP